MTLLIFPLFSIKNLGLNRSNSDLNAVALALVLISLKYHNTQKYRGMLYPRLQDSFKCTIADMSIITRTTKEPKRLPTFGSSGPTILRLQLKEVQSQLELFVHKNHHAGSTRLSERKKRVHIENK